MAVIYEGAVAEDLQLGTGSVSVTAPGGGSLTGTQINLSTFALTGSATWNPGSIASGSQASTTVTVTGAAVGNVALASLTTIVAGCSITAQVTATNTVSVTIVNNSGGALVPASGTLRVLVFQVP